MSDGTLDGPVKVDMNRARHSSKRQVYDAWRAKYQGDWVEGKRRVDIVKKVLQDAGHAVCGFGFYAESTRKAQEMPSEPGIPDLQVLGLSRELFLEVTGTSKPLTFDSPLWIRPDKFGWALKHLDKETWAAHVLPDLRLVRFILLDDPYRYGTVKVSIRGGPETYLEIPSEQAWSADRFLIYLDSLRPLLSTETKRDPEKSRVLSQFM
jgi:hypothetical protein